MPSFDLSSDVNLQELDNAVQQANKEITQRFDFKGVQCEIKYDAKEKMLVLWCSEEGKLDALKDVLHSKMVKRGVSLLNTDEQKIEPAFGGSVRQRILVQAGISKEKAKEIVASLKTTPLKVVAQIQEDQLRISGKSRDELQAAVSHLRQSQDRLKLSMTFGNFRD